MKIAAEGQKGDLVRLVDELAPVNNRFRMTKDPVVKVETMWDFGGILNRYVSDHNVKLDRLLLQIYDPHSTVKMSYITRDLGSYSSRIKKYFRSKNEIRSMLNGLYSPGVFREAIPLLFNPRYNLTDEGKQEIIKIITTPQNIRKATLELRRIKKSILPINNPRTQKANKYQEENKYLQSLFKELTIFYSDNDKQPSKELIDKKFGTVDSRTAFVVVLMALAGEAFLQKISDLNTSLLNSEMKRVFSIVESDTQERARFRKWAMDSNHLLKIAEALHSLDDENNYRQFRNKLPK